MDETRRLRETRVIVIDNTTYVASLNDVDWDKNPRFFEESELLNLFDKFAHLEESEESILQFANCFGMLSDDYVDLLETKHNDLEAYATETGRSVYLLEPISHWFGWIRRFKYAFNLWQILQRLEKPDSDTRELDRYFEWKNDGWVKDLYFWTDSKYVNLRQDRLHLYYPYLEQFRNSNWNESEAICWYKLWTIINDSLQNNISTHFELNLATRKTNLAYHPHHLLAILWYQFAIAVSAEHKIFNCPICGILVNTGQVKEGQRRKTRDDSETCGASKCRGKKRREGLKASKAQVR